MQRAWERGSSRKTAVRVAATVLTRAAVDRGSKDNVTVVIIDLKVRMHGLSVRHITRSVESWPLACHIHVLCEHSFAIMGTIELEPGAWREVFSRKGAYPDLPACTLTAPPSMLPSPGKACCDLPALLTDSNPCPAANRPLRPMQVMALALLAARLRGTWRGKTQWMQPTSLIHST